MKEYICVLNEENGMVAYASFGIVDELIRCKDCRYFEIMHKPTKDVNICNKTKGLVEPEPEGHCHYAERMDEDG